MFFSITSRYKDGSFICKRRLTREARITAAMSLQQNHCNVVIALDPLHSDIIFLNFNSFLYVSFKNSTNLVSLW